MHDEGTSPASAETRRKRAVLIADALHAALDADLPLPARTLAEVCRLTCDHESNRRRVREAVDYGRTQLGYRICANAAGYWLARNHTEWAAYQEARKRGAKFEFVRLAKQQAAATHKLNGQGVLFETHPIHPD